MQGSGACLASKGVKRIDMYDRTVGIDSAATDVPSSCRGALRFCAVGDVVSANAYIP